MALARGRPGSVARRISSQAQRCSSPGCVLRRLSPTRRCSCSCFSFDFAATCSSTATTSAISTAASGRTTASTAISTATAARGGNLGVAGARALFCSGLGTVDNGVTAAAVRGLGTGVPGDRRAMTGVEGGLECGGKVLSGPRRLRLSLPPPGAAKAVGVYTAAAAAVGPCIVGGGDVSSASSLFPPQPRLRRRGFDIVGIRGRSGAIWRGVGGGYLGEEHKGTGQWRSFATEPNRPPKEHLRYIHRAKPAQSSEEAYATAHEVPMSPLDRLAGTSQREAFGDREGSIGYSNGDEPAAEVSSSDGTRKWLKGFTAEDILRDKSRLRQKLEVRGNCTVEEAITIFVNQKATSFLVVNQRKEVIGMFTSRDLLSELARYPNKADGLKVKARDFMIPLNRMIYCSMKDSLYQCLLVMSELKVRNLPVVSEGKVMGIVNVNDISDFSFSMEEIGGKKAFMNNVSQRKGLPKGVGLDPKQNRAGWKQTFSASVGTVALPHPHKLADGRVSANKREHRHLECADDPSLSEDAYFVIDVAWPTETTDTVNYVGIADGVGSWRRVGVDPREFSHRLMHWAREYILSMAPGPEIDDGRVHRQLSPRPPKPHEVLQAAWEYTIGEKVVGSSTACVAALDYDLEQLTFSNIGDCGVVVLRHIDSDVAGYMREKQTPRHLRDSDLRLAFISQQQLRSFNLPYQFGYTNVPEDNANFETPRDAVNTSFPVRPGDIILLATDGLFDNMELDDICAVALEWEYKWFGGPMRGLGEHNNAAMEDLALQLGHRARELSLDDTRDSPFALLAKENDVMWGGGMPDDITVVALRVVDKADSQAAAVSTRGLRFDDQHDVIHKNDQHQDDAEASG